MKAQTRLSHPPRSWRSRAMACGLMVWALAASPIGLWADNNQSDFGDSAPFPLDTTDQATYGMGDSNGFPLDTGGDDGTVKSGSGMSPSPGFRLDTRSNPASVDFNQSGMGEFGPFTLDTGGPPSSYENNQSDFNDSGGFKLDTNDPILSGFSDSPGFPLDTGGENGEIKTDSGDSAGFPLDTRDSGSNGNLAQFDFNDSNGFPLDTGGSSGSAPNQAPVFQSDGNLSIPENQTFVFDFNATDPDADTLTYSLPYGDDHLLFELNASTGILTFLAPKDFESPEDNDSDNRYEATVQVSDGNASTTLNLFVQVTDIVESAPNQAPAFQSDGNLSVPENQTFVFDFNATDPDGDTLTYSLPYGDDHLLFELNASTGILSFLTPKDFESPEDNDSDNRYEATVQVSDGNASATLNLFVQVTDIVESAPNQAPAFQSDGNLSVPENQTFVFEFNATDPDGDTLTYSLPYGDDHLLFELNASTGVLSFLTPKDFESPEDNDSDNRYEATVQVSDGNASATLNLLIQVTDVVESTPNQPPAFQSDGNLSIPENQTFVFDFNATDADGDTLTYSLPYGDDHQLFELNASTGILTFLTPKDFESPEDNDSDNRYEATVQVSDGNASVALNLFVHVTDIAESGPNQAPVFQSDGNLSIPENQTFVFDFNATDLDGDTLTYSLPYGDDHLLFDINASTGILTFLTPKDFESPEDNDSDNRYEATIQVSDGNASATLNLFVQVTDVVENAPNQAPAFQSDGNLSIPENQTFVFDFNATDPDGDTLSYSLPYGDDHLLFDINASTGILSFLVPKDFESPEDNDSDNRYEATVQVSDGNASAILNLFVQVTDVVENSTKAITSASTISGTVGSSFLYYITTDVTNPAFEVANLPVGLNCNASTGEIFGTPLAGGTYLVTLVAQSGSSNEYASATLTITLPISAPLLSVESPGNLVLTSAKLKGSVLSTGGRDATITVYWGDNNANTNASNWDSNANLGSKGQVALAHDITGLTGGTTYYYAFKGENSAGGTGGTSWSPVQSFTTPTSVSAPILGNLHAVTDITSSAAKLNVNLQSTGGADSNVTFYWGDNDGGTTAASWDNAITIVNAQPGNLIGEITNGLSSPTIYYFRTKANNWAGTTWATTSSSFTANSIQTSPPAFQSDGNLSIPENQTFVFDFNATDPDGDTLTYSLPYGDDHLLFELNASTGVLSFLTPKDFESPEDNNSDNRYEATIQVSDGNASATLNLFVQVTNVVESAPNQAPAFQSDGNLSIPENQAFVFDFNATDADGDTLTYSLPYGDDHLLFELNASTGILSFLTPKDFESSEDNNSDNRYEATLLVSDGNTSAFLDLFVQVTDVVETIANSPPVLPAFAAPLRIAENSAIGTVAGHLQASDPDPEDTLTFSLTPITTHSLFNIEANGSVRTISPIDFEKNASHLLFFRVIDRHGAFVDGNVTVEVIDLFRPVAETGIAESITETSAILQGYVLDDGGMPVTERGFLLSPRPSLKAGAEGVLRLIVDQNSSDFSSTASGLQPGKKYFYRAYASNEEGIALGSKETFVTPDQGSEPTWIDAQPSATKDWWISSWFGSFYQNPNGWALHEQLGWVFPVQSPTAGLWLWKEEMGWLWTDEGIYPFLYHNSNESWLYFYGQLDGSRLFYDYDRKEWIILRDDR